MAPKHKKKMKKLNQDFKKQCQITKKETSPRTVLDKNIKPELLAKWPKPRMKVPDIFLHKPIDFEKHVRKIITMGIRIYQPYLGRYYTKISCLDFHDHLLLTQYFNKIKLPYHTFGHPTKKKIKMVIRGLPKKTDLKKLKDELTFVSIPVIRIHKMRTKESIKKKNALLVLVVVPHDDEGKRILRLTKALEHDVTVEPPRKKSVQCYRCQKWGHSQRYCNGRVKCVKCAGDHLSQNCTRNPETDPLKCVNCDGEHTASYRKCSYCPDSIDHKRSQTAKKKQAKETVNTVEVINLYNYRQLYRNVNYDPNED